MGQPASRDGAEKGKINHGGSKSAPQQLAQKQRGLWKGRFGEQELLSPPLLCSAAPNIVRWCPARGCRCPKSPGAGATSSSPSTSASPGSSRPRRKCS